MSEPNPKVSTYETWLVGILPKHASTKKRIRGEGEKAQEQRVHFDGTWFDIMTEVRNPTKGKNQEVRAENRMKFMKGRKYTPTQVGR